MTALSAKWPALERLGLPGVAGMGLLLFCLSFYLGNVMPLQGEVARLEADKARLATPAGPAGGAAAAAAAQLQSLPSVRAVPELLRRVAEVAQAHGLAADRAAYELKTKDGQRRLQVTLPLIVTYPALRAYLRDVTALAPAASLDDLRLKRKQANEPTVDANVVLSYELAAAP